MTSLEGQVALITGAGSGIGRAMAVAFLAAGARVLAVDRLAEGLEGLASSVRAPESLALHHADLTDPVAIRGILAAAETRFGPVDVVCNNAGMLDRMMPLDETDDPLWEQVMAVNLTAPMRLTRAALPAMLARGRGVFVNTASIASFQGGRGGVSYTVSKHGLLGLTRAVAAAYGAQGIRCNAVAPGSVKTSLAAGAPPSEAGWELRQKGLATRPPQAEAGDIAPVAVFLASPEARYLNGALIVADAGWTVY
ncbi:SDR family NAD(P)-dependent oxidoreductase [Ancylobacter lacus]|uniref:SDR family NAD(P)-dependent oxidoreductase n=1 Tax=Ancylobacter lacus TaxID=2579970 RepID=UPI001BCF32D2|nr:SDR family oxidoreductase [Ancylobacter lacus]MBS7540055.1 SDR family oxidoreductase [Ancylobacter lacus]